jgi:probable F420-dependent oxidoreductase
VSQTGLILDADSMSDLVELAKNAEDAMFDSVWATELYRTSFQQLSAVAQPTRRVKLGTAVALAFVRSPLITTLTALDLDEISNGRLVLGLGTGAKRTNELLHGVSYGRPVPRIKECIQVIRLIMNKSHLGEPISYSGDYYNINTKGYHRPFNPLRDDIPVYLAGVGKYMTRAAGEVADGYLGHVVCSLKYIRNIVCPSIKTGLENSRRDRKNFKLASIITCAISNDKKEAMQAARATIAFYSTVRTYEPPFKMHGFQKEAEKIRDAFFKRDVKSMIENVSDDMVETFAVVGNADECRRKVEEYREYLDLPILSAPHYFLDFEEVKEYQRAILEVFGK